MLAHAPARPETKRSDIERAALHLFVTRGLRGTTVRAIAARAGVAEGTLYRHWRSKRDLARAVYRGCAETVAGDLRRAAAAEASARGKLTAAIRALFRAARDEILLYELLVLPPSRDTQNFLGQGASPADVLAGIVAEGQRRREFVPVDSRLVGECILGAVHRIAIARRLAQYEQQLAAAVLASLTPAARRRTTA